MYCVENMAPGWFLVYGPGAFLVGYKGKVLEESTIIYPFGDYLEGHLNDVWEVVDLVADGYEAERHHPFPQKFPNQRALYEFVWVLNPDQRPHCPRCHTDVSEHSLENAHCQPCEDYLCNRRNKRRKNMYRKKSEEHKEQVRREHTKKRDRWLANSGKLSKDIVERLIKAQGSRCAGCDKPIGRDPGDFHKDHIMPRVLGGTNTGDNIQLLCVPCNFAKRDKHPEDWRREQELKLANRILSTCRQCGDDLEGGHYTRPYCGSCAEQRLHDRRCAAMEQDKPLKTCGECGIDIGHLPRVRYCPECKGYKEWQRARAASCAYYKRKESRYG